jgi:hypothetical protein
MGNSDGACEDLNLAANLGHKKAKSLLDKCISAGDKKSREKNNNNSKNIYK